MKEENTMKKNVGGIDKVIRIIIGIAVALAGFFVQMGTGLRIGAFVVASSLLSSPPLPVFDRSGRCSGLAPTKKYKRPPLKPNAQTAANATPIYVLGSFFSLFPGPLFQAAASNPFWKAGKAGIPWHECRHLWAGSVVVNFERFFL